VLDNINVEAIANELQVDKNCAALQWWIKIKSIPNIFDFYCRLLVYLHRSFKIADQRNGRVFLYGKISVD